MSTGPDCQPETEGEEERGAHAGVGLGPRLRAWREKVGRACWSWAVTTGKGAGLLQRHQLGRERVLVQQAENECVRERE
jgi:hypothetical protein